MRQFVPVYLQNINICLSHVPTPRGRAQKEAARVCGGCVCPLYVGSGRVCVCACVYALKVARVDRLAGGACSCACGGWFACVGAYMCAQVVNVYVVRLCGHVFNLYVWGGRVLSCGKWSRPVCAVGCLCVCVQCVDGVRGYMCAHVGLVLLGACVPGGNESENESELVPKTNQKPIRKCSKKPRFPRC